MMTGLPIRRRWLALIVLAAAALLAAYGWRAVTRWHPDATAYPVQGIDVSAANGAIDWATVGANGVDFAYLAATQGAAGRDPTFAAHWDAARAAGLRRGAVHAFSWCASGTEQARNFIVTVPRVTGALPAAVALAEEADCPAPPRTTLIAELRTFLRLIERHSGQPALLLIPASVEERYTLSGAIDRTLWAVGNFRAPAYLARPWRLWRANDRRRIDGIAGPVNWDVVAP